MFVVEWHCNPKHLCPGGHCLSLLLIAINSKIDGAHMSGVTYIYELLLKLNATGQADLTVRSRQGLICGISLS